MTLFRKIFSSFCWLNFVLLIFVNTTPLWLTFYTLDEYYLVGLWVVCTSKSCRQLAKGVYPDAIRALAISALIPCFVTLLSSSDLLSQFLGPQLYEMLISSVGNYLTGICLMGALLMTFFMVQIIPTVVYLSLNFYLGCFVCFSCGILGVTALFQHIQKIAQRRRSLSLNY